MSHLAITPSTRRTALCRCVAILWMALVALSALQGARGEKRPEVPIQFNRDVRPILSNYCFACHGPDSVQRQADLRLDDRAAALADRGGYAAIVPHAPDASELVRRITAADPAERMPPEEFGKTLSDAQIDLLRRWIASGAEWQPHWSFVPPVRPSPPHVDNEVWTHNPIDAFVLARLTAEGLRPAEPADRATLIRRVTLDLTGLPPTPDEVDAFLADESPDAYERLVDRLLASPRYGERMAIRWLEAARYADTSGYQSDGERDMWRWRDWVIEAFNRNLPFDRFTVEQIAGDLLPDATLETRIASGFHRNHRTNAEGGVIPEEFAVEYVADRVETTGMVWLGLTIGCARCHDHKFDPISQREFYELFAFFNQVPEQGRAIKFGNSPPQIKAPTREQAAALAALDQELAKARDELAACGDLEVASQLAWERQPAAVSVVKDWTIRDGLEARFRFEQDFLNDAAAEDPADSATDAAFAAGPDGFAAVLDGDDIHELGNRGDFGFFDKFSIACWIRPNEPNGTIVSRMREDSGADGYNLCLENGKLQVNLIKRWLDDALRVATVDALPCDAWRHIAVTYDGSRVGAGVRVYVDGKPVETKVLLDELNQSFQSKEPLRLGAGGRTPRFSGAIDDLRIYRRCLTEEEAAIVSVTEGVDALAALAPERRTAPQAAKLRGCFLACAAPAPIRLAYVRLTSLEQRRAELFEAIPTTMVMAELPHERATYLLERGDYTRPGESVTQATPRVLHPFPVDAPRNRLGLAQWLVDPANPLTARVAVNRFWQMYFGTGLVKTAEDFGWQGELPSHPELLDYLATEFIRAGWEVKALQKLIVMSAAYRQSSRVRPELLERDPENRLLARGPRFRLPAEMIRDQALSASGLLVEKLGGPSVKPYQPDGLWKDLAGLDYVVDRGEGLYRRSMYTYWKRTVAPPTMLLFDSPTRETCSVRQSRTNTPLQALALMNEPGFVEAARGLAERMAAESTLSVEERLALAFRLVLARPPRDDEINVLSSGLEEHRKFYAAHPSVAQELLKVGDHAAIGSMPPEELAAYTVTASLILNLDEAVTRP